MIIIFASPHYNALLSLAQLRLAPKRCKIQKSRLEYVQQAFFFEQIRWSSLGVFFCFEISLYILDRQNGYIFCITIFGYNLCPFDTFCFHLDTILVNLELNSEEYPCIFSFFPDIDILDFTPLCIKSLLCDFYAPPLHCKSRFASSRQEVL